MKKSIKLNFCGKNDTQISGFSKKCFSKKKSVQLICADTIFKTVCRDFFEINGSRYVYISVVLRFRKIALFHKIINKTRLTKNDKNSAHRFGDNYLTDHLLKFQQARIKL